MIYTLPSKYEYAKKNEAYYSNLLCSCTRPRQVYGWKQCILEYAIIQNNLLFLAL